MFLFEQHASRTEVHSLELLNRSTATMADTDGSTVVETCDAEKAEPVVLIRTHSPTLLTLAAGTDGERVLSLLNAGVEVAHLGSFSEVPEGQRSFGFVPSAFVTAEDQAFLDGIDPVSYDEGTNDPWQVQHSCGGCCPQELTPQQWNEGAAARLVGWAQQWVQWNDFTKAGHWLSQARQLMDDSGSWENVVAVDLLTQEAILLELTDRKSEALPQVELAAAIAARVMSDDDWHRALTLSNHGETLLHLGRHADAEPLLAEALKRYEDYKGPPGMDQDDPNYANHMAWFTTQIGLVSAMLHLARAGLPVLADNAAAEASPPGPLVGMPPPAVYDARIRDVADAVLLGCNDGFPNVAAAFNKAQGDMSYPTGIVPAVNTILATSSSSYQLRLVDPSEPELFGPAKETQVEIRASAAEDAEVLHSFPISWTMP
jgi:hypothetical protein